jgi:hypothetical protein
MDAHTFKQLVTVIPRSFLKVGQEGASALGYVQRLAAYTQDGGLCISQMGQFFVLTTYYFVEALATSALARVISRRRGETKNRGS